ncbi:AraC family transcriptional regulator [Cohnella sp.]|uniref:AraC family transcriptional regulator n=1 Tax=Cohnella sp. TaxID=1883426 RepID=UPI00356534EF
MRVSIPREGHKSSQLMMETGRVRSTVYKLDLLEAYMDNGDAAGFLSLYNKLFQTEEPLFAGESGRWLGLELFLHLSAFFLTYMNKRELIDAVGEGFQTEKLYKPDLHAGWRETIDYFGSLGVRIADRNSRMQTEHGHELIVKVHRYIDQYLHEELSLTKFAEFVCLSPPYFSRIYKQITGKGLLEYINETRIRKAKLLLKTTDKKIHEIAAEVGLESAPYFTRLFRKKTGRSPQEYRDSSKGLVVL